MLFARRSRKGKASMTALETIEAAENQLVAATWKGSPCIVKVRRLSDIEIQAIGNFSLIETDSYKWSKLQAKTSWAELLEYADKNVKICKAALVSPTYDQIFEVIGKNAFFFDVKARVEHINKLLADMPPGPAKQELENARDSLILAWDVILPEDFMAGVIVAALGIEKTDIKKITEDMLYSAAILADRGKKAPHEYIHGVFSDFNIRDIDTRAWIVFDERMEEAREAARQKRDA
jgi:hypothetical protein